MATKPNYFRAIGVALLLWRAWEYFKTQGRLLDQWNWAVKSVRLITLGKTIELELLLDITNNSNTYADKYTEEEKALFERRLEKRIDKTNPIALQHFLCMYANPVVNSQKYINEYKS